MLTFAAFDQSWSFMLEPIYVLFRRKLTIELVKRAFGIAAVPGRSDRSKLPTVRRT
jgi:hypothetical protein